MWTKTWLHLVIVILSLLALYWVLNQQVFNHLIGTGIVFAAAIILELTVDFGARKH